MDAKAAPVFSPPNLGIGAAGGVTGAGAPYL